MTPPEATKIPSALPAVLLVVVGVSSVLVALAVTTFSDESVTRAAPTSVPVVPKQEPTVTPPRLGSSGGGVVDFRTAQLRRRLAKTLILNERDLRRILNDFGRATDGSPTQLAWLVRQLLEFADPEDHDLAVRRTAVALLGRVDRQYLIESPFVPLFRDPDAVIRREAVAGRARHGLSGYEAAASDLAKDGDASVRLAVAKALGSTNDSHATNALFELLFDPDRTVVRAAAKSLGRVWSGPLPSRLVEAASSEQASARLAVALTLESLRGQQSTNLLAALVVDPDWQVREAAVKSLARARSATAGVAAQRLIAVAYDEQAPRHDRFEAIQALARLGAAARDPKIAEVAVGCPDPLLRLVACRTALAQGDARVLDALVELLDVERGPHCDDEDMRFIHRYALETLQHATGLRSNAKDAASWKTELALLQKREVESVPVFKPAYLGSFR